MYHFIRRFFIFVLVLAFGFSFLLCCFLHTGCCQSDPWSTGLQYLGAVGQDSLYTSVVPSERYGDYLRMTATNPYFSDMSRNISPSMTYQLPTGSAIQLNDLMFYQTIGQFPFSGSTSSVMDRSGNALGGTIQHYFPNLKSQSSITGGAVTGVYRLPITGTGNYSLPYSVPSGQMTGPLPYMWTLPASNTVGTSLSVMSQKLLDLYGSPPEPPPMGYGWSYYSGMYGSYW